MAESTQSKYLQYLPAIFQRELESDEGAGPFLGRFLIPFEHVFAAFEEVLATVDQKFSPALAPAADFLPWLATWLALVLDEEWDEDKRRRLLAEAMQLYQWRGTVHGLKRYLEIYTGLEPEDIDIRESRWPAGMQIGVTSRIGFRVAASTHTALPGSTTLFHRHPHPEQADPNVARYNELVDLIVPPNGEIEAVAHDDYRVTTMMPTDLPPGTDPATVPATEPFQIVYRTDTVETIGLEKDGVRLRYGARPPKTYATGTRVGGTFLVEELPRPYGFVVDIRGLDLPHNPKEEQEFARRLGKIRLILDAEKPAHTQYFLKFTPATDRLRPHLMQIGIRSSIGLDTTIA
jgi:phage tail-like protein